MKLGWDGASRKLAWTGRASASLSPGYLLPTGLALILAPETVMKLLQARDDYGDVMPRVMGILFLALLAVVLVGFVLTLSAHLADAAARRRRSGREPDGGLV